jgi:hypothetical protein
MDNEPQSIEDLLYPTDRRIPISESTVQFVPQIHRSGSVNPNNARKRFNPKDLENPNVGRKSFIDFL